MAGQKYAQPRVSFVVWQIYEKRSCSHLTDFSLTSNNCDHGGWISAVNEDYFLTVYSEF